MNRPLILYVMGVSGSGKSTVGKLLANTLDYPFYDGDDFHPKENIEKMATGHPLNDIDRKGWLESLNALAISNKNKGAVIVCSALKEMYRDILGNDLTDCHEFIYLEGSIDEISERLEKRENHFMPKGLLQSQFDTLEVPKNAIKVSIRDTPKKIVDSILANLQN